MEIKSLPHDVKEILRSAANINSVSQCIMELVLNSLDANATAIAVRINLLTLRIQVVDNGFGVARSNMDLIGIQYMTSKCYALEDLQKTKKFGFRGEALASICKMARKLDIVSKVEGADSTYSKTYENGKWSSVEVVKTRPGVGTTVTITEFLHNFPVRQKRVRKNFDLDETKRRLEELAVVHCNVSFSLRNDATGKIILQSKQTRNVAQALISFYPYILIDQLEKIKVVKNKISVTGLIYKSSSTNKNIQFIYLNKRPIISQKMQKFINNLLSKIISKGEHPVYCLNIRCPYSSVDLTMSPSKTTVEFKESEIVYKCIEKAIKTVLENQQLIPPVNAKPQVLGEKASSFKSQFGVSQIAGAVIGKKVKRKIITDNESDVVVDTQSLFHQSSLKKLENSCKKNTVPEDLNQNTQSMLFSSVTEKKKLNSLLNATVTTNVLENQNKGKELIMDMFLKSTVAYATEQSQTDDIRTVVIGRTTKSRGANTTMTMTVVSKKTILKNSRVKKNDQNMISKCVQTTMVQQHQMIDFDANKTISKYFEKSNGNLKTIAYFGNFGKNVVPSFGRTEYFFRPVPNFSQNTNFADVNLLKDPFLARKKIFNFLPNFRKAFPLYRRQLSDRTKHIVGYPPHDYNFKSDFYNNQLINPFEFYSPYFPRNRPHFLNHRRNNINQLEISPYFKQPILKKIHKQKPDITEIKYGPLHNFDKRNPVNYKIPFFCGNIFQKINTKKRYTHFLEQNKKIFKKNFEPSLFNQGNDSVKKNLRNNFYVKPLMPNFKETEKDNNTVPKTLRSKTTKTVFKKPQNKSYFGKRKHEGFDQPDILIERKSVYKTANKDAFCISPFFVQQDAIFHKKQKLNFLPKTNEQGGNAVFQQNCLYNKPCWKLSEKSEFSLFRPNLHNFNTNTFFKPVPALGLEKNSSTSITFQSSHNENLNLRYPSKQIISQPTVANIAFSTKEVDCNSKKQHLDLFETEKPLCFQIPKTTEGKILNNYNFFNKQFQSDSNKPMFLSEDDHRSVNLKSKFSTDSANMLFNSYKKDQFYLDDCLENKTKAKKNLIQKSKLSLRRCISESSDKHKTNNTINQSFSFDNENYDLFQPNLCSTKILEHKSNSHGTNSEIEPNTFIHFSVNSRNEVPRWIPKEDKLGNKFYLNSRTGMTSVFSPKKVDKFDIAKRVNFVPKGLSPLMAEDKNVNVSMSPNSKKKFYDVLMESYKNELQTIKWSNLIAGHIDIRDFFQALYNEKTKQFENCIPNASINMLPKCMIKLCNNAQAQPYSKEFLSNLDIIGQWDQKFIIAFHKAKQTLIVFDQHAVSERIRLEKLYKEYKEEEKFKGTRYDMKITKTFSNSDLKLLAEFTNIFQNLGIRYKINENVVNVTHVPKCIVTKNDVEHVKNLIISIICEQLEALKDTRGVGCRVPNVLQNAINSEACRGAIKFGDLLSITDSEDLIQKLNLCQLPFQCAHGRPTFAPIIGLDRGFLLEHCKPNLQKLKNTSH